MTKHPGAVDAEATDRGVGIERHRAQPETHRGVERQIELTVGHRQVIHAVKLERIEHRQGAFRPHDQVGAGIADTFAIRRRRTARQMNAIHRGQRGQLRRQREVHILSGRVHQELILAVEFHAQRRQHIVIRINRQTQSGCHAHAYSFDHEFQITVGVKTQQRRGHRTGGKFAAHQHIKPVRCPRHAQHPGQSEQLDLIGRKSHHALDQQTRLSRGDRKRPRVCLPRNRQFIVHRLGGRIEPDQRDRIERQPDQFQQREITRRHRQQADHLDGFILTKEDLHLARESDQIAQQRHIGDGLNLHRQARCVQCRRETNTPFHQKRRQPRQPHFEPAFYQQRDRFE